MAAGKKKPKTQWRVWVPLSENGSLVHEYICPWKSWIPKPNGGSIVRATLTLDPRPARRKEKRI